MQVQVDERALAEKRRSSGVLAQNANAFSVRLDDGPAQEKSGAATLRGTSEP
jgi:hypothetical protein